MPFTIKYPIKLLLCIEEHLFDGSKIYFDQMVGGWIVPINLSLFITDECFIYNTSHNKLKILIKNRCLKEEYYFQIQCSKEKPCFTSSVICRSLSFSLLDIFNIESKTKPLFIIIWESEIKFLISITYGGGQKIFACDFKRVKILDRYAVIIPLGFTSFKNLKYFLKMKTFNNDLFIYKQDSIEFEYNTACDTDTNTDMDFVFFSS